MGTLPLSLETERRLTLLFAPGDQEAVRKILLDECGNSLPFLDKSESMAMDRFRFAALRLSDGSMEKLHDAIRLAKVDWRDLLVAAQLADDVEAHRSWLPVKKW